ncbi:uncharacterized protein LOC105781298 [Gossypium raimondii]|uniref:uncharacterized protein LOC105781298 n=1 Tax=Gossypium raimondii TaxID=29730 RepID=UPI00063AD197|nr:uncharacterized protein LOC105781298 [Gossypium raimondii]
MAPLKPPYPKWYDPNTSCMYHTGNQGHSTENCLAFKRRVQDLIDASILRFDGISNPLPNHADVNVVTNEDERQDNLRSALIEKGLQNISINVVDSGGDAIEDVLMIRHCPPRYVLNNWTAVDLFVASKSSPECSYIHGMNNPVISPEIDFEKAICLGEFEADEDAEGFVSSHDLLRMVEQEEKQILPHQESIKTVNLGSEEKKQEVKIETSISGNTKQNLIDLLYEYKDVFVWSYQDMPGLNEDVVVHRLPLKPECKPVQQKLRRMRPEMLLKIKEEVKKQYDAGFLQVSKYPEWVANIVPVPKKYGKVRMYVDYRDLNRASPKENFPLPHIDTLVDNTAKYSLFSFMDGFSGYNQIKMAPEDMEKTTFVTMSGTFCYKVMPFRLKNTGATYQRAMLDPLKYLMESPALSGRMTRWQILLSKYDIVYVSQKSIKGSAIADFLASRAMKEYEPLRFDFPDEDLMGISEGESLKDQSWNMSFDGASNALGHGIGAVLVSLEGNHYPLTARLNFFCTNNIAEYEACIMGLRAAIEWKIEILEVYGDLALVIYQIRGYWKVRDSKLVKYRDFVAKLVEFKDVTFQYFPREENQLADALATLASMFKENRETEIMPLQMSIYEAPVHCFSIEKESDGRPWFHDILEYIKNQRYPEQANENDKRIIRRMAAGFVLDGDILYKRGNDQMLLRCVDNVEARRILEDVHEGICGTHANGFTMARQIMRLGYFWLTVERDCISYHENATSVKYKAIKFMQLPRLFMS